jgi:hypothetical protein
MSMRYSDHVYSNASSKILDSMEPNYNEEQFLKLMQDKLCEEIDSLAQEVNESKLILWGFEKFTNRDVKAQVKEWLDIRRNRNENN